MKKAIFPILIFIFLLLGASQVFAAERTAIYFFWGEGCPHCEKEKPFLKYLENKYPEIKVYDFEIWQNAENRKLLTEVGKKLNVNVSGVPFTVIGNQYIVGYYNDAVTGQEIENKAKYCLQYGCTDLVGEILGIAESEEEKTTIEKEPEPEPESESSQEPKSLADESYNEGTEINLYFFSSSGCPLCNKEKEFLESLKSKYKDLKVHIYDLSSDKENTELFKKTIKELSIETISLPLTVVGKKYFVGWYNEEKTGRLIEEAINCFIENNCPDVVGSLISPITPGTEPSEKLIPEKVRVPILGEIETKNLSLPLFAIVMGGLDGFNPCAMWVLLFLITLLFEMKDRKRMWILGSVFIVSSSAVYFLFMAAWLNLILFIGFIFWIRLMIGLLAMGGGAYNLREFFVNKTATCKVTGGERKQKIFEKLKEITQKKQFWLALGGIIILAVAVNLVELICSAGLPVVFTQVLALSNLAKWQYYLYILLYIFIFMLDDLFVFFVAMKTLQITGITNKYSRLSHLIGGVLMLIIGLLLIFKPAWLMFG